MIEIDTLIIILWILYLSSRILTRIPWNPDRISWIQQLIQTVNQEID